MSRNRKPQLEFDFFKAKKPSDSFGGALLKNSHARVRRPLDSKLPIHLVLRSNKSVLLTPVKYSAVQTIIDGTADKYGVTIFKMANVGNHIHFAIRIKNIRRWAAFIRELTGRLALLFKDLLAGEKLWSCRPFTRIVRSWKKAFENLKLYIEINIWEAEGRITRRHRTAKAEYEAVFGTG